jgi:hypothetical protein
MCACVHVCVRAIGVCLCFKCSVCTWNDNPALAASFRIKSGCSPLAPPLHPLHHFWGKFIRGI